MDAGEGLIFNSDKIETLQNDYYASAFSGDLQSDDFVNAFRTWLNEQTGGRLKDMIDGIETDPSTIMLIASTVDFAARWDRGFNTEPGYFKCDGVRRSCTYLSSVDRWNDKVYFGDGYTMYRGCRVLQKAVKLDNQVLIDYITQTLGGVVGEEYAEPYGEGRIVSVH